MGRDNRPLYLELDSFTLENGLRVIFHRDDSVPVVAVNLWYHVGSKDEAPHRTGLAHLFEHLMFEGSEHHDDEYFKPLQQAGGAVNGSTNQDRTNYYEVVPSDFLELALWMEADRMGYLLPVLTQSKLDNQRKVVKNERRQRVENQPYGLVSEKTAEMLYASDHPYSWPVIGYMSHLDDTSLDDVHNFFRQHYHPGNASLAVCGSFEPGQAREWVEKYFGSIQNRSSNGHSVPEAKGIDGPLRLEMEDAVALPRLDVIWPTRPRFHEDEPAVDLAAAILAGGSKDSRLKRRLIHQERLVTGIGGYHHTMSRAGQFVLRAYGLPKTDCGKVEAIIAEEIQRFCEFPPSEEEVQQVRFHYLNDAYSQVETVLGKANTLNHYLFHTGTVAPDSIAEELERYESVTAEQIHQAAQKYLLRPNLTVQVTPTGHQVKRPSQVREKREEETVSPKHQQAVAHLPPQGEKRDFALPTVHHARTSFGLKVQLIERRKLPQVHFKWLHAGGAARDPLNQFGTARLTSEVADEGTTKFDGLALARKLDQLGASLAIHSGVEVGTVAYRALQPCLNESMALLADVLLQPRFAEDDLERERQRLAATLAHRAKQPSAMADEALDAMLFGAKHPYGRSIDGTIESLDRINADDLRSFYAQHVVPEKTTLIVVGDVSMSELIDLLEKYFATWKRGTQTELCDWPESQLAEDRFQVVAREGAPQSVLRLGKPTVPRKHEDYFPLVVLNTILGGQFASRLNLNLREDKGYTYGARSAFYLRQQGGAFIASADVQGDVTTESVREMLKEIHGLAGDNPVTQKELDFAKAYLCRRFPARFETASGIAAHLAQIAIYDLPEDFYDNYMSSVEAVTVEDLTRAAANHLSLKEMRAVVVGDPSNVSDLPEVIRDYCTD